MQGYWRMIQPSARTLVCLVALVATSLVRAAEPPVIAMARAFVGSETTLDGLKSVRFVGTMTTPEPKNPSAKSRVAIELVFQKPDRQIITTTSDALIETTVLDGYDAWQEQRDPRDATKRRVVLLGTEQIRRLRASTWENLSYFRGLETRGGKVIDLGVVTIDGVVCRKIGFLHGKGIEFYRYFDTATAHLVRSETESGMVIREQGEMMVGGIRFPRSIITLPSATAQPEQAITVTFDKVVVNDVLADSRFAVPVLRKQLGPTQPPAAK